MISVEAREALKEKDATTFWVRNLEFSSFLIDQ